MGRGWLGVDLDGTLAEHITLEEWEKDPLYIGEPIPDMLVKVKRILDRHDLDVYVFTARVAPPIEHRDLQAVRNAIRVWTHLHLGVHLEATCVKDRDCQMIWDDRARQVVLNQGRFVDEV